MKLKPVPAVRRVPRDVSRSDDADAPLASDVRGLIDNATADRLYGWAWDANHPGARLKVELRLAGEVVANTIADFVRPDLAKSGVGDGCHAFEFPLVPSWIDRRAELSAVAFGADGTEFPIAMRIRRQEEGPAATAQIARAVESLLTDQEAIRAEFAALRDRAKTLPDAGAVAAIRTGQEDLGRKVEQLELWLTRLDGKLGDATLRAQAAGSGRLDKWQAVLIAFLASSSSAALAVAVARYFMLP
jgi:hypothetical protein